MLHKRYFVYAMSLVATMCCWVAIGPPSASASFTKYLFKGSFGSEGEGFGQLAGPFGVAVNRGTGDIYIADSGNNRIEEFSGTGEPLLMFGKEVDETKTEEGAPESEQNVCTKANVEAGDNCGPGTRSLTGEGGFSFPRGVAVDNSSGDVYVTEFGQNIVQKFTAEGGFLCELNGSSKPCIESQTGGYSNTPVGVAVDSSGNVYVAEHSEGVKEFNNLGELFKEFTFAPERELSGGIAVDDGGNSVYLAPEAFGEVEKYGASSGEKEGSLPAGPEPRGIVVDPVTNDVYVDETIEGETGVVEYTPQGAPVGCGNALEAACLLFGPGIVTPEGGRGIAINPSSDNFYIMDLESSKVDVFEARATGLPKVGACEAPTGITTRSALLHATVDPEGAPTSYRFIYGTVEPRSYIASTPAVEAGSGFASAPVSVLLSSELKPSTRYYCELLAYSEEGTVVGAEGEFTTLPAEPPRAVTGAVTGISVGVATLNGALEASGLRTHYIFQYAATPEPQGCGAIEAAGSQVFGDAGFVLGPQAVAAKIEGLAPGVYYFRLVASNSEGTVCGAYQAFAIPGIALPLNQPLTPALLPTPAVMNVTPKPKVIAKHKTKPKKKRRKKTKRKMPKAKHRK